jgi:hypothetical protein
VPLITFEQGVEEVIREPPTVHIELQPPPTAWQGGPAAAPAPPPPPPPAPVMSPLEYARHLETQLLNSLPNIRTYPYYQGGRASGGTPPIYVTVWQARMEVWVHIPPLATIPPRLPMALTDRTTPGRSMMVRC